ncbi:prolyl oligopeptidase family serine peptidase [Roseateles sp. DB2]|uniref:alpha/beta hydrolase family protein n=1 Tax=Roseateles sp. DB2 TaxID=3453717 RepID=UPI003EE969CC
MTPEHRPSLAPLYLAPCLTLGLAIGALLPLPANADEASGTATASAVTRYQQPSQAMRAVLDAPGLPAHSLSPDQKTLAVLRSQRYRQVADLARPALRLAGMRIDPAAHAPLLSVPALESLVLRPLEGGVERAVPLPPGGGFHHLRWSPDSRHFLLNRRTSGGVELWLGQTATGQLKQLPGLKLNTVLEQDVAWQGPDTLLVLAVPPKLGPAPRFEAPDGPTVQESLGRQSPERTLQDLLRNAQDELVFAHYARSQLTRVNLRTGQLQALGEAGLFAAIQAVGTQGQVLTERLRQPFSYQVTWQDFGRDVELRDAEGRVLRALAPVSLKKDVPVDGVITGPRHYTSSPGTDAALYWTEALDGGDPRRKAEHRDRLMRLAAPYTGEPQELHRSVGRVSMLEFLEGGRQALVADVDRERQWLRLNLLDLGATPPQARLLSERSLRDRYKDIGQPLRRVQANGRQALRVDEGAMWLVGAGASPEGERPFLDRIHLADGRLQRLYRAGGSHYERPMAVLDAKAERVLFSRESATEVPQLVLRSGPELAQMQAITRYTDPAPQLRDIQRELVKFKRADGVELSFWLYKPPGYQAGERRPAFVWAYPLEFTDASVAGQVSGSGNRFTSFGGSSPLMLLLDGYVVLMDATMPVVGDPKTVNDSFIAQITSNAQAIIDKAAELGVSSRSHMVVGGHSYGAFMTANLLAHTDLFKAGIARSGAYNRSLTPFGFQSEQRTYWEAQDVYQKLSPFNYADKLKEPLLLIHGDSDDNPGTFPIQSQRLYQALSGTGGHVRFVSLPHEGHGYTARESIGHTLWEMSQWMKRQVGEGKALD